MVRELSSHPVAKLFPIMSAEDLAALTEDVRLNGVRVPILVHGGQILDGRHRYKACQKLGIPCPSVEWDGRDPWLEVQSRNLVRRHLGKDQIYAIRVLASARFPELMAPIVAARNEARQRKVQAKDQPRGTKALSGARGPSRTADVVGVLLGVSGSTVKRVDRLARIAPELVPKVAAGELSVKKALREVAARTAGASVRLTLATSNAGSKPFAVEPAIRSVQQLLKAEWARWPMQYRGAFLVGLHDTLRELSDERVGVHRPRAAIGAAG